MATAPSFINLLLFFLTLSLFYAISHCYILPLQTDKDALSEWKFPKDRPYHYFHSTNEIPSTFLPVQVNALPNGTGLWLLRYKDFSGEAKTFSADKRRDTSKSVLTFSSNAQLFDSVTIKVLGFGDIELNLDFQTEKVSLVEYNENCTNSSSSEKKKGLNWIIYQVNTAPTSHLSLEAKINHENSFIILDEILVYFGHNHHGSDKTADSSDSDSKESVEEHKDVSKENRVICRVVA